MMCALQEWSSVKWKELFRAIQLQDKPDHSPSKSPMQLLLDMPIRWSSTYVMLNQAEKLKEVRRYHVGHYIPNSTIGR